MLVVEEARQLEVTQLRVLTRRFGVAVGARALAFGVYFAQVG